MGRPDDVDSDSYTSACSEFYYANHAIIDKVGNLGGRLASSGAMAGSDAGGQEWAKQYDASLVRSCRLAPTSASRWATWPTFSTPR